jgi:esterase
MSIHLASTRIGATDAPETIVMLHGMYGWGRNWAAIAKGLVARRPEIGCVLLDLPYHGASGPTRHEASVIGLAADVADWCQAEGISPAAVLGHSFGGKVTLALTAPWRDRPLKVWSIDSTPSTRQPSGSAWELLQIIREVPADFAAREQFVAILSDRGWAPAISQWMATNLERRGDRFAWRLDFDVMERLLRNFYDADLWPVVENPAPEHTFHFIKATESSVMTDADVERARALGHYVHHLEGSHWIHAERPQDVVALLAENL